jgi:mannose-1-phosphate guanylyltransferase
LTYTENPVLLILPADHVIDDIGAFHQAIEIVTPAAVAGKLVTFGVCPTAPENRIRLHQDRQPVET